MMVHELDLCCFITENNLSFMYIYKNPPKCPLFFFPSFCFFDMLISIFEEEKVEYSSPKNLSIVYGSTALLKKALINTSIHQKDLRVCVKFSNKI